MMWKGCDINIIPPSVSRPRANQSLLSLSVVTDSPSPIVVVLSGSMEPAFQRGDLLFLCTTNPEYPQCHPLGGNKSQREKEGMQG